LNQQKYIIRGTYIYVGADSANQLAWT